MTDNLHAHAPFVYFLFCTSALWLGVRMSRTPEGCLALAIGGIAFGAWAAWAIFSVIDAI